MNMRITGCVLGVALAASGCAKEAEVEKKERPPKRVEVEAVRSDSLTDVLSLPATIEAREATTLATGRGGRVDALGADEGAMVKKGQTLVRINAGTAYAEMKQAEAAFARAQATYDRTASLSQRKLASAAQVENATADLAQASAARELARASITNAVLRAPHSGYVDKRHISVGEFASPGSPLIEVVDIDVVKVIARVPERDIDTIERGATANFTVDALGGESFSGKIERIGVSADAAARTFEVELRLPNTDHRLKPGMLARVQLPRRSISDMPVIRRDAVVEDLDGPTVFVARDGKASRVRVRLGPINGDRVVVTEGLEPGTPLIVVGQRMLVEGEPIKVVGDSLETATATDTAEPADAEPVVVAED
ncbi:MAG: efflux RND transporter periplasmic adaptor subunit [Myxococcota bacterium]